jgi:arabinose-5-phosphate isomerase
MTAKPVSVRGDQLAVDALRIFETHNIDDLPVTNALGHLIGSVDIQDLPKFKIM